MRPVTEEKLNAIVDQLNAVLVALNERLAKVEKEIEKKQPRRSSNDN